MRGSSRPYRTRDLRAGGFPGFHPGLFSWPPSGRRRGRIGRIPRGVAAGQDRLHSPRCGGGNFPRVSPWAIFVRSLRDASPAGVRHALRKAAWARPSRGALANLLLGGGFPWCATAAADFSRAIFVRSLRDASPAGVRKRRSIAALSATRRGEQIPFGNDRSEKQRQ